MGHVGRRVQAVAGRGWAGVRHKVGEGGRDLLLAPCAGRGRALFVAALWGLVGLLHMSPS